MSEQLILTSKIKFFEKVKDRALKSGNSWEYFRAVSALAAGNCGTNEWSASDMFSGLGDAEIAEKTATFFNRISNEYTPQEADFPMVDSSSICPQMYEISAGLRNCKETRSRVKSDLFSATGIEVL